MEGIFDDKDKNLFPIGGLMPIDIPAVFRGVGKKLRDRMYRTIRPEEYSLEQVESFVKGTPRQYYRNPNANTNLVPNVYEVGVSGVKDAESMLELRRAGKSTAKSLSNAPYWLLPNATEHIPTKSVLFNPTIIDKFGKMHIDWNDPNIFKGIAYPTIFGSTLYNLNNE